VNRPPTLRLVGVDPTGEPDDVALVAALASGENWAATAVWNRYAPMVYGVLDRALGSAGESEDLTQEVFWRIFAAIRTLRDPSALRSFIYSSTIRMLRWHLRSRSLRRMFMLSDSGEMPDRPVPAEDCEGRALLGVFYRLLDTLSANDRTAFVLRHVEGLALREITEATGASLATVKRRVRRASDRIAILAKADPELVHYVVAARRGESDDR